MYARPRLRGRSSSTAATTPAVPTIHAAAITNGLRGTPADLAARSSSAELEAMSGVASGVPGLAGLASTIGSGCGEVCSSWGGLRQNEVAPLVKRT